MSLLSPFGPMKGTGGEQPKVLRRDPHSWLLPTGRRTLEFAGSRSCQTHACLDFIEFLRRAGSLSVYDMDERPLWCSSLGLVGCLQKGGDSAVATGSQGQERSTRTRHT